MKKKEKANYAHSCVCSPLLREEYMCVSKKKEKERERKGGDPAQATKR